MTAARPNKIGWPRSLQEREKLSLSRSDAVKVSNRRHVIIGFDARNDSYICWRYAETGDLEAEPVRVPKYRAQNAERLVPAPMEDMPTVDHRGRLLEDGGQLSGYSTPMGGQETPVGFSRISSSASFMEVNAVSPPQEQAALQELLSSATAALQELEVPAK